MTKTCTTCGKSISSDDSLDITALFRLVKTFTGYYHRNVCRKCENANARRLRKLNYKTYNYSKTRTHKQYYPNDYLRS